MAKEEIHATQKTPRHNAFDRNGNLHRVGNVHWAWNLNNFLNNAFDGIFNALLNNLIIIIFCGNWVMIESFDRAAGDFVFMA